MQNKLYNSTKVTKILKRGYGFQFAKLTTSTKFLNGRFNKKTIEKQIMGVNNLTFHNPKRVSLLLCSSGIWIMCESLTTLTPVQ